eukprot:SAG22_NODE_18222_length_291_cov_0.468750_1_plen_79_part_10
MNWEQRLMVAVHMDEHRAAALMRQNHITSQSNVSPADDLARQLQSADNRRPAAATLSPANLARLLRTVGRLGQLGRKVD